MATFFRQAANRDYSIIQQHLVSQYGGNRSHYPALQCAPRSFFIRLPEYLDLEGVLHDLELWAVQNQLSLWRWESRNGWNEVPFSYNVYLKLHNFPIEFWHPQYFHLVVAGFGIPLYVDDANILGMDRSSLKMVVRVYDPSLIPQSIIINHENQWQRVYITLVRWSSNTSSLPDGYDGPTSGELQGNGSWGRESPNYSHSEDELLRSNLSLRMTLFSFQTPGSRRNTAMIGIQTIRNRASLWEG